MAKQKYISEYLLVSEYQCPHCDEFPPHYDPKDLIIPYHLLFEHFDTIRQEWGKAIRVPSGYRCPIHNSWVGGSYLSAHLFGLGLDLGAKDAAEVDKMAQLINELFPEIRMGVYRKDKTFIHIDIAYYIFPRASHNWKEGIRWND